MERGVLRRQRSSSRGRRTWREQGTAPRLKLGEREHASPGSTSWARGHKALQISLCLPLPFSSFSARLCCALVTFYLDSHSGLHSLPLLICHASLKPANVTALSDRLSRLKSGSPLVKPFSPLSRPPVLGISLFPVVSFMTHPPHPTGANKNSAPSIYCTSLSPSLRFGSSLHPFTLFSTCRKSYPSSKATSNVTQT